MSISGLSPSGPQPLFPSCLDLCWQVLFSHTLPDVRYRQGLTFMGNYTHKFSQTPVNCGKWACVCAKLLQSCPTLWDLMDCSPPGTSVHGVLRERSRLLGPPPGGLPDPGFALSSLESLALAGGSLPLVPPGKPLSKWDALLSFSLAIVGSDFKLWCFIFCTLLGGMPLCPRISHKKANWFWVAFYKRYTFGDPKYQWPVNKSFDLEKSLYL